MKAGLALALVVVFSGCAGSSRDVEAAASDAWIIRSTTYDYEGRLLERSQGSLSLAFDTAANTGSVHLDVGSTAGRFESGLDRFHATLPWQSGGVARNLQLHGETENGSAELPGFYAYVAAWGTAELRKDGVAEKDPTTLATEFRVRLLVARGHVRDAETGIIYDGGRDGPYDPAFPEDASIDPEGAQALVQFRTATDELWYQFGFDSVVFSRL